MEIFIYCVYTQDSQYWTSEQNIFRTSQFSCYYCTYYCKLIKHLEILRYKSLYPIHFTKTLYHLFTYLDLAIRFVDIAGYVVIGKKTLEKHWMWNPSLYGCCIKFDHSTLPWLKWGVSGHRAGYFKPSIAMLRKTLQWGLGRGVSWKVLDRKLWMLKKPVLDQRRLVERFIVLDGNVSHLMRLICSCDDIVLSV